MRVRVHSVQSAQAGEIEVAEDVLGDQWRSDQQRQVRGDDRHPEHSPPQRAHGQQHCQVARGHDQRERLEAVGVEAHTETREGASQPAWPAPAAGRDILRWTARGARGDEQDAREHTEQAEHAEHVQERCRDGSIPRADSAPRAGGCACAPRETCQGGARLHALIVTSRRPATLRCAEYPVGAARPPGAYGCECTCAARPARRERLDICDVLDTANPHNRFRIPPGPAAC